MRKVGRPRGAPGGRKHTLVLSKSTAAKLDSLIKDYTNHHGIVPTISLIISRALSFSHNEIVTNPPEFERLRLAADMLDKLKKDSTNIKTTNQAKVARKEIETQLILIDALKKDINKVIWPKTSKIEQIKNSALDIEDDLSSLMNDTNKKLAKLTKKYPQGH